MPQVATAAFTEWYVTAERRRLCISKEEELLHPRHLHPKCHSSKRRLAWQLVPRSLSNFVAKSICTYRAQAYTPMPMGKKCGMDRASILECIEQAIVCSQAAVSAASQKEKLRLLRWARAWLEEAKYKASRDEASAWTKKYH